MVYPMAKASNCIALVDDDPSVLKALARLLGARALRTKTYRSARLFLESLADGLPDCLILDLQMPEMTGLELQHDLVCKGVRILTIIITGHNHRGMLYQCKSTRAIPFLLRPVQETSLFSAIEA